jgi:hypothetical protein
LFFCNGRELELGQQTGVFRGWGGTEGPMAPGANWKGRLKLSLVSGAAACFPGRQP